MGGINFEIRKKAMSLNEAYDSLYEDAVEERGNDIYNGTISTTHGVSNVTYEFKKSGKSLDDFISEQTWKMGNGECMGICLKEPKPNTKKVKSMVKHGGEKGTRKWLLKYCVFEYWSDGSPINSFPSKGDAVKYARQLAEKNKKDYEIRMMKVLEKGSPIVATVSYKKGNEQLGEYVLFGVARC